MSDRNLFTCRLLPDGSLGELTFDSLDDCPRCGETHVGLVFRPVTHDVYTHVSTCPVAEQAIFVQLSEK